MLAWRAAASKVRSALSGGRSRGRVRMAPREYGMRDSHVYVVSFRSRSGARSARQSSMKLYRFRYSPYARKVQMVLELAGIAHDVVEVRYGEREELARLTGGYIHVPVLALDDGEVITESRRICERLVARPEARHLVPAGLHAAVWAYHDFLDGPVEDVLFRLASPAVRAKWPTAWERSLYTLIKERKFGAGCVDAWEAGRAELIERGRRSRSCSATR